MNNKTLVFAHRGANREAAENTRAAFDKALNYPIDGIETDVQLSRDEVPVLWHDRFLDKLGHPDKRIDDFDYAQLEQMDFAGHFSEIQAAEGVLGFREFADSYRGRCSLQVEIKNRDWETAGRRRTKMEKCLEIIGPVRDQEIFISSFDFSSLEYAGRIAPGFPFYYALREEHDLSDLKHFLGRHAFLKGLCMPIVLLDETVVGMLRRLEKGVVTYTCNSDEQIRKALDLNVDVMITDDAPKALRWRDRC